MTEKSEEVKNNEVGWNAYLLRKSAEILSEARKLLSDQNLSKADRTFVIDVLASALEEEREDI